jgi:hypothetical protein
MKDKLGFTYVTVSVGGRVRTSSVTVTMTTSRLVVVVVVNFSRVDDRLDYDYRID